MHAVVNESVTPAIQPALDLVMPAQAQIVATVLASLGAVYAWCWMIRESRATCTRILLYFWLGSVGMMFSEPIWDLAQTCVYPHVGQHEAFELIGRLIPLYSAAVYLSLGVFVLMLAKRIRQGVDGKFVWKAFFGSVLGLSVFEIIPINVGLWGYFGAHPWPIFGFPLGIGLVNATSFLSTAVFTAKVWPSIAKGREFLAMFICPIVFVGVSFGVGWPLYSVANTARALDSAILPYLGFFASLMLSIVTVWCLTEFTLGPVEKILPVASETS